MTRSLDLYAIQDVLQNARDCIVVSRHDTLNRMRYIDMAIENVLDAVRLLRIKDQDNKDE